MKIILLFRVVFCWYCCWSKSWFAHTLTAPSAVERTRIAAYAATKQCFFSIFGCCCYLFCPEQVKPSLKEASFKHSSRLSINNSFCVGTEGEFGPKTVYYQPCCSSPKSSRNPSFACKKHKHLHTYSCTIESKHFLPRFAICKHIAERRALRSIDDGNDKSDRGPIAMGRNTCGAHFNSINSIVICILEDFLVATNVVSTVDATTFWQMRTAAVYDWVTFIHVAPLIRHFMASESSCMKKFTPIFYYQYREPEHS